MSASTYWVEDHSEEKFTTLNTLVQLLRTSWVFFVENCVSKKPTGLSWKNLKDKWPSKDKIYFNQFICGYLLLFSPSWKWWISCCLYSTVTMTWKILQTLGNRGLYQHRRSSKESWRNILKHNRLWNILNIYLF